MSHRRPDPSQAMLEQTLRRALRLAADSIEPAGDGLQRIRGKIAAGPPPSLGAAGWRARYMSGLLAMLMTAAWFSNPSGKGSGSRSPRSPSGSALMRTTLASSNGCGPPPR